MKKIKKIFFLLTPALLLVNQVYAAGLVTCSGRNCTLCSLFTTLQNVVNFAMILLITLAVVMVGYSGIQIMTSVGDPTAFKKSQKRIFQALLGIVIAFAAWVIVDLALKFLIVSDVPIFPWNRISC